MWTVQNAPEVEKAVQASVLDHHLGGRDISEVLAIRADREFFELPYGAAFQAIGEIVHASRREL